MCVRNREHAGVAKLVDAQDLKSWGELNPRMSSILIPGTRYFKISDGWKIFLNCF